MIVNNCLAKLRISKYLIEKSTKQLYKHTIKSNGLIKIIIWQNKKQSRAINQTNIRMIIINASVADGIK